MNQEEYFALIPHGKKDKPILLFDPTKEIEYDLSDADGPFAVTNKELVGCGIVLPFSKPIAKKGCAYVNDISVPVVLAEVSFAGHAISWVGIKAGGSIRRYGQKATVRVENFVDIDGNTMNPVEFTVKSNEKVNPLPENAAHERVALQAAEEGIVLLKNKDGVLPLKKDETLNVFGKGQHEFRFCALGAGKTNARYNIGFSEAAEASEFTVNEELSKFYACGEDCIPPKEMTERAVLKSDKAIVVISRSMGENYDASSAKGDYYLTDDEQQLLTYLKNYFARVIVILNVGYPIETEFIDKVDAVLYTGFGGMLAGQAIVNILNGTTNPSGKLPDTWALRYEDIPSSKNFYDAIDGKPRIGTDCGEIWLDTVYEEDIYVGYRYFQTFGKKVGFPFGFGLSYTTFSIRGKGAEYDGKHLRLSVEVRNTGSVAGKETVQIYLKKPDGKLEKPARELIEFEKTRLLAPKEIQTFSFCVPNSSMTCFDEETSSYVMEKGTYEIYVGNSSVQTTKVGEFAVKKDQTIQKVKSILKPIVPIVKLSKNDTASYPKGLQSGVKEGKDHLEPLRPVKKYRVRFRATENKKKFSFAKVQANPDKLDDFVSALSVEELARIAICADSGWSVDGTGEAGSLYRLENADLPKFIVTDGNSGINLKVKNIGMPSGATIAASFNKQLAERIGVVIGEEGKTLGSSLVLAPSLNIHRNPLCGRQPEYFSEDPFLSGKMAGSYCRGLESTGVGGCYKHFVCNNAETSRKRNQSVLSERALREIYLASFRYAFEEHVPVSVMTAYNAVNGAMTSTDPELIQGFLRDEMHFDGFVMTDWTSYDSADVVDMAEAGNCWITPGSQDDKFTSQLVDGVKNGRLREDRLRENVYYFLKAILKLIK